MNGYLASPYDFRREVCNGFSKFALHSRRKAIEGLILENAAIVGTPALGYFYKFGLYGTYKVGERAPDLHKSLHEKGEAVMEMMEKINRDIVPVHNFITKTTNMTREERDLRILLPDCLHQYLEAYCQQIGTEEKRTRRSTPQQLQEWFDKTHEIRDKISAAFALHILIV